LTKKKAIAFLEIGQIAAIKTALEIKQTNKKSKKFSFKTQKEAEDCAAIATSLRDSASGDRGTVSNLKKYIRHQSSATMVPEGEEDISIVLTPADWTLLLKGSKCTTYAPGTYIVTEGIRPDKIFQISKGNCSIMKRVGGSLSVVAERKAGDIMGEMSFLDESEVASASVVAACEVEAYVLEYNYLSIFLSIYKHLAPKFYKYLALLIEKRFFQFITHL